MLRALDVEKGSVPFNSEGHVTLEHMIHEHRAETREDKRELQALIQTSHDSLKEDIQGVREDLSAKIEDVGRKVDGHEDRIRFLERKAA